LNKKLLKRVSDQESQLTALCLQVVGAPDWDGEYDGEKSTTATAYSKVSDESSRGKRQERGHEASADHPRGQRRPVAQ
jgi:hypothetical protein